VFSITVSRIVISVTVNKKLEHRHQCCSPSIGIKQDRSNLDIDYLGKLTGAQIQISLEQKAILCPLLYILRFVSREHWFEYFSSNYRKYFKDSFFDFYSKSKSLGWSIVVSLLTSLEAVVLFLIRSIVLSKFPVTHLNFVFAPNWISPPRVNEIDSMPNFSPLTKVPNFDPRSWRIISFSQQEILASCQRRIF